MDAAAPLLFVSANVAAVATPGADAVTLYEPTIAFAVKTFEVATPDALVTAVAPPVKVPLAPLAGAVNVTVTPLTGFPPLSFTVATSFAGKAVLIAAVCGVPPVAAIDDAVPLLFVSAKVAGLATPGTDAVTLYEPTMAFAVKTLEVAIPDAFVTAVAPPANVPPAPLAGAANVTVTPLTGFPPLSLTVAMSFAAKAVLIVAVCGVPPVAAIDAAAPALFVSAKSAGAATPTTDAVTLYDPAVAFAVKTFDVATPEALVTAVAAPANAPVAPLAGAVNVTVTPLTGLPPASFTVTTKGAAKAVLIVVD
jgi:hypothetical protein